ncbi:MAG TPA: energy transducer TonB [Terracidiphilus sp.]|nr:energy transducer TonB [Terracidiphilus sp.]
MFEDSTFESNGTIHTRSRGWMIAALALNSSILLALILIPLIYPEALPSQAIAFLMEVPPPPTAPPPAPPHPVVHPTPAPSEMYLNTLVAPRQIPQFISLQKDPAPEGPVNVASWEPPGGVPNGKDNPFASQPPPRIVHPDVKAPVHLPSVLAQGLLLRKVIPQYPQLARAMRKEGTVVLAATIAKDGTIVNLRVVSGPAVLQQAALEAVSQWRYRPYLLNGDPVEVETTVNVIFTLGQ